MTTRTLSAFIFLILFCASHALSSDTTMTCSMFRLKLKDSTGTGGTSGRLIGNSFSGFDWDKKPITVDASDIARIDSADVTLAFQGATYGAMVGLFGALAMSKTTSYTSDNPSGKKRLTFGRGVLWVSGGAIVGAIVGSFVTKWKAITLLDSGQPRSLNGDYSVKVVFAF